MYLSVGLRTILVNQIIYLGVGLATRLRVQAQRKHFGGKRAHVQQVSNSAVRCVIFSHFFVKWKEKKRRIVEEVKSQETKTERHTLLSTVAQPTLRRGSSPAGRTTLLPKMRKQKPYKKI